MKAHVSLSQLDGVETVVAGRVQPDGLDAAVVHPGTDDVEIVAGRVLGRRPIDAPVRHQQLDGVETVVAGRVQPDGLDAAVVHPGMDGVENGGGVVLGRRPIDSAVMHQQSDLTVPREADMIRSGQIAKSDTNARPHLFISETSPERFGFQRDRYPSHFVTPLITPKNGRPVAGFSSRRNLLIY
jgi:hypothetical protein